MLPPRLTNKVVRVGRCWLWTGTLQPNGYGYTKWKVDGRWKNVRIHRIYYEEFIGPIPSGLEIDHTCRMKNCVHPKHLRAVTHAINLQTRDHKLCGPKRTKACKHGHRWTAKTTGLDGRGHRYCKACNVERMRRWRASRPRGLTLSCFY